MSVQPTGRLVQATDNKGCHGNMRHCPFPGSVLLFFMSARRIARELAVILLPQLPKDQVKLEKIEVTQLLSKSCQVLTDYAKQCLADADALMTKSSGQIVDIEEEHPKNSQNIETLAPVPLTSAQLKEQLQLIERAIHLVAEALDIPEMAMAAGGRTITLSCKKCGQESKKHLEAEESSSVRDFVYLLVSTYVGHRAEIDELIGRANAKWKLERMVTIDRDILRLAITEAFFLADIPVAVAINEAIELSHRFADDKAAKFLNGILRDLVPEAQHFRRTGTFTESSKDESGCESSESPSSIAP